MARGAAGKRLLRRLTRQRKVSPIAKRGGRGISSGLLDIVFRRAGKIERKLGKATLGEKLRFGRLRKK